MKELEDENFALKEKNFLLEQQIHKLKSQKNIPLVEYPKTSQR